MTMPRTLVILLHAWVGAPVGLQEVAATVRQTIPSADLLIPPYSAAWHSSARPAELAAQLAQSIATAYAAHDYEETLLIGHSLGGLLITKAFLYAAGATTDLPISYRAAQPLWKPWSHSVKRIIVFAGLLHGWSLPWNARQLSPLKWLALKAAAMIAIPLITPLGPARLIASVRQKSPFVNRLPHQWQILARTGLPMPHITQLHGDQDELLAPQNIRAPIPPIRYLSVPNTAHENIVQFSTNQKRRALFLEALQPQ